MHGINQPINAQATDWETRRQAVAHLAYLPRNDLKVADLSQQHFLGVRFNEQGIPIVRQVKENPASFATAYIKNKWKGGEDATEVIKEVNKITSQFFCMIEEEKAKLKSMLAVDVSKKELSTADKARIEQQKQLITELMSKSNQLINGVERVIELYGPENTRVKTPATETAVDQLIHSLAHLRFTANEPLEDITIQVQLDAINRLPPLTPANVQNLQVGTNVKGPFLRYESNASNLDKLGKLLSLKSREDATPILNTINEALTHLPKEPISEKSREGERRKLIEFANNLRENFIARYKPEGQDDLDTTQSNIDALNRLGRTIETFTFREEQKT